MIKNDFLKLLSLFENNDNLKLKQELGKYNEADIAEFLSEIDEIESIAIFRLLPTQIAIETFSFLDVDMQESFISAMTKEETTELFDNLYIDDMVDIIEHMPDSIARKIMRNIDQEKRDIINEYLSYPKDTAGSIMTPTLISLKEEKTIKEILDKLRDLKDINESFYTLYAVDKNNELKGYVNIRDILTHSPETKISEITNYNVKYVETLDDKEDVAKLFDKYEFLTVPVVDKNKKLVGVVTFDDAIQVLHEEAEEDFHRMAGMSTNEKKYMDSSIFELFRQRFVWILLLMFSSTLSQYVIEGFNDVTSVITGLIAFMPMLTGSAGNAGSQASTTVIRGLSLEEIEIKDIGKILRKEFVIAILVGGGLAIVNFVRILIFSSGEFMLSLTVSLSLLITIVLAKLFGSILPIIATLFKTDPTIMAAPLLTTIVDSMSLFIYFSIAKILML